MEFETDKNIIGEKIKRYRKNKKMTQFELAEKIGLNVKQVSRIEAGLNYPTYLTLIKIFETLDIDANCFLAKTRVKNLYEEDFCTLLKNSNELELKTYVEILKPLKKNLKLIQNVAK